MKETLEKNRLIAEFMELKMHDSLSVAKTALRCYEWDYALYSLHALKFHKSWDWIMPVVEKIESHGLSTKIYTGHTTIASRDASFISQKLSDSKIDATYEAVVEFINWYTLSQGEKQL